MTTTPPASADAGPVLRVEKLTTSFRKDGVWTPVVRGIDLEVAAGETLAMVGESGSGKSVAALSIMRLLPPGSSRVEGRVTLAGRELMTLSDEEMRAVRGNRAAMIFQEPMTSLNPILTIGDQIIEALDAHRQLSPKAARDEAIRLIDRVRIPNAAGRLDEFPHQFSGGMRQRVMIAMALACRPKLLIADEPTTALDVTIQGQILDLIKELQEEEGMAILFITHDMGVVAEIADRVVVMYRGEAIEQGPTGQILTQSRHPYTRALISAVPRLGAMGVSALPARFAVVDAETGSLAEQRAIGETRAGGEPVLKVSGLTTRFGLRGGFFKRAAGTVHAVENVSFELQRGETLALVGESGCGKSTTGRSITRLVEPSGGEVLLAGRNMRELDAKSLRAARRRVQMIFQDPYASLNPRMSIGTALTEPFIEHGLGTRAAARDKAAALLEKVGLGAAMMPRFPHEFSGGQRQRIAIARSLMLDPDIIIADEAVSALDVSIKAQVCNLLLDLQQDFGLAYLFISHDMAVVERISHRVAVMHLGEIVEIGPREKIFGDPQHSYTRKLIAAVPSFDPSRRRHRRDLAVEELKSPIRPPGYVPPERSYREVSAGHFVQD